MTQASTTQLGEDRATFMARVRKAVDTTSPVAPPPVEKLPDIDEAVARNVTAADDLPGLFTQRAGDIGMTVHPVAMNEVVAKLGALLAELDAKRISMAAGTLEQELNLGEALPGSRTDGQAVELVDWRAGHDAGLDPQFDLDAGVTDVQGAVAETGTLICNADAQRSRGLSLVPPVHIALVRESDIVPDLVDYYAKFKNGGTTRDIPSSIAMITGPSKTSDIEGMLITGVHGPGRVEILLIRDV